MIEHQQKDIIQKMKRTVLYAMDYTRISFIKESIRAQSKKDAIFIWIPKTAGTSIYSMLDAPKLKSLHALKYRFVNKGVVTFGHMDYKKLVEKGLVPPSFDERAYKFAFARNPYDRAASLYTYMKKKARIQLEQDNFLSFCRYLENTGFDEIGFYNYKGNSQCNPQMKWIENINIDYLGKMETLETDIREIFHHLKISHQPIPHKNKSSKNYLESYYCQESKEIVENLYDKDFRHLNYQKQSLNDLKS